MLSTSGHIAALVNPPTNPKATSRSTPTTPPTPSEWLAAGRHHQGSWWPDFAGWLGERSGPDRSRTHRTRRRAAYRPLTEAPGTYVFEN